MTTQAKKIKETLDKVSIEREVLNQLCRDRLDFGFDSIFFRYAEAIEELGHYKEKEAKQNGELFDKKSFCDGRKLHFYNCLEQLLRAHEEEKNNL